MGSCVLIRFGLLWLGKKGMFWSGFGWSVVIGWVLLGRDWLLSNANALLRVRPLPAGAAKWGGQQLWVLQRACCTSVPQHLLQSFDLFGFVTQKKTGQWKKKFIYSFLTYIFIPQETKREWLSRLRCSESFLQDLIQTTRLCIWNLSQNFLQNECKRTRTQHWQNFENVGYQCRSGSTIAQAKQITTIRARQDLWSPCVIIPNSSKFNCAV